MNDGGPAYPRPISTDEHINPCSVAYDQQGMSLRDYFAAKAMQIVMDVWDRNGQEGGIPDPWEDAFHAMAEISYQMADAMLKARKEEP